MNEDSSKHPNLDARLASMKQRSPDAKCLYHAVTLTADDELKVEFSTCSHWVGWTDDRRHEIRQSRLVYAEYVQVWEALEQPYCFVHAPDELTIFLVAGGNALIEKDLAEKVFSRLLGPDPSIPDGRAGFKGPEFFDKTAFNRAPTPRLRMQIFKRDGRRCRICGRRPDDNTDLVLHIHHIRPWKKGGVTDPANLITLCHTCHGGLDPHEDHALFEYILPEDALMRQKLPMFSRAVSNYRKVGFFNFADEEGPRQRKRRRRARSFEE
jgi:hypothetical protein